MLQAVEVAKAHEIMARFRPIAPKPEPPFNPALEPRRRSAIAAFHLRSRPCRTRKRGRISDVLPPIKRQRSAPAFVQHLSSPAGHPLGFSGQVRTHTDAVTLSLLPVEQKAAAVASTTLVERDLLQELQKPKVITPLPVRPVGSSISIIGYKTECSSPATDGLLLALKKPETVEEELESQPLPAMISDAKNKVRLVNSAYKEMVGQPECPWLDATGSGPGKRRINGEVMLDLPENWPVPEHGFSCRVNIEWGCNGKKTMVNVPCDVVRLSCESKDYYFAWRFHTGQVARSDSNAY